MARPVTYTVVLPAYNEEENVDALAAALFRVMDRLGAPYEILFVDDGSTDGTADRIRLLASRRKEVRLLRLRTNFGQAAALAAGFDHARGEVVVSLDADLQNDPEDIPRMIRILDEGHDVVCGWRKERKDGAFVRLLPSRVANALIRRITGVRVHDYGCTLKVFRNAVAKHLPLYGGLHRYIPALAAAYGARIAETVVTHHPRRFGQSKYTLGRTVPVLMDLLFVWFAVRFSRRPYYLFAGAGMILTATGFAVLAWLAAAKVFLGEPIGERPLLDLGTLCFLGGLQLISLGLLAGLLYKFHVESSEGATYAIREIVEGRDHVEL